MASMPNQLFTMRVLLLFVFVLISFPTYSNSGLKSLETDIANEIYDLKALLDSDALETDIYEKSRKKLILFVSRYQREGGNDYRFILPAETVIQDADLRTKISKVKVDAYRACVIEYAKYNDVVNVATFCQTTISKARLNLTRDIGEVFESIEIILTSNNKLNGDQAQKLLEEYYLIADEKNIEIERQLKAVELVEKLKKGNINNNGDEFSDSLMALKAEGLAEDIFTAINDEFIKQLIELAILDIKSNRLSTPIDNNALNKYNNILKLDEYNPEAKQGLIDVANKYIDLAKSSAEKGKTVQVRKYIEKALEVHPNIISNEQQRVLLETSTYVAMAISKEQEQEQKTREVEEEKYKAEIKREVTSRLEIEDANILLQEEKEQREEGSVNSVLNQHISIIRQRVKRYWIKPTSAERGLQCTLQVSLFLDGGVKQVKIIKSSGSAIFDRSAENAVYKAAPLPIPTDPAAASELRDFQFVFSD